MKTLLRIGAATAALLAAQTAHADATLKGSYLFDNTLSSSVAGAPDLTLTDPTGTSAFFQDSVFGKTRTVLHIGGDQALADQGGLTFNDGGGLLPSDDYSIALSFKFEQRENAWRRIVDVENRQSDAGFYVDPSNQLDVFPVSGSNVPWTNDTYENVVLTVGPGGDVHAYLQGVGSFQTTTTVMNLGQADNPDNLINLFLDNVVAGGQQEWSVADIAAANFYQGVMTQAQVDAFNRDPTAPPSAAPEPGVWAMMLMGLFAVGAGLRRRRQGLSAQAV